MNSLDRSYLSPEIQIPTRLETELKCRSELHSLRQFDVRVHVGRYPKPHPTIHQQIPRTDLGRSATGFDAILTVHQIRLVQTLTKIFTFGVCSQKHLKNLIIGMIAGKKSWLDRVGSAQLRVGYPSSSFARVTTYGTTALGENSVSGEIFLTVSPSITKAQSLVETKKWVILSKWYIHSDKKYGRSGWIVHAKFTLIDCPQEQSMRRQKISKAIKYEAMTETVRCVVHTRRELGKPETFNTRRKAKKAKNNGKNTACSFSRVFNETHTEVEEERR
ncbi:hypothetical protein ACLOJK_012595 [Asimina triloba]